MTPSLLQNKGQALVESLIGLIVIVPFLSSGLFLIYASFAKVWLNHVSYESLMCLSERQTLGACSLQARQSLHQVLPGWSVDQLELVRNRRHLKSHVKLSLIQAFHLTSAQELPTKWVEK